MSKGNILIVDDSRFSREFCSDLLQEEGFTVKGVSSGLEALDMINAENFDLVILDLVLPDLNGEEVLKRAKQIKTSTDFIIITGHASLDSAINCLKGGASDYLTKPLNPEEFKILVNRIIDQKRLFEENEGLKRLVKLYEVSRVISSCLDYEKFPEVILDSLLQIVEGNAGLSIFYDKGFPNIQLKAFRGVDSEGAKPLADTLISHLKSTPEHEAVGLGCRFLSSPGTGQFLVMPVKNKDEVVGYAAIYTPREGIFRESDIENARFISEQASLSLENVHLYKRAMELTYIDDLTKLHNIRYLDVILDNEIKRAKRFKSHLSLLFIDIDYFKNINDTHGHRAGSRSLSELGKFLKGEVREVDTVIRYGGDEFIILLIETTSDGAVILADRIRKAIEDRIFLENEGLSIRFTITIGIATYPEHAADKERLLDLADNAMYKGKQSSRNKVVVAHSS